MDALIKDILNRVGTKAIVAILGMYFLFELGTAETSTISPLWFAGGIVGIILAFFLVRYVTNDKEDIIKNGGNGQ
jgi:hypothetical protein